MDVRDYRDSDQAGLIALVQAVAATGGAVGWLSVPSADEVLSWKRGFAAELVVAVEDGQLLGCGAWRAYAPVVVQHLAEVTKVMTHPDSRGRGAGRAVVIELLARVRASGAELVTLECRGNNHAAQRLYADLGFLVTGRRPDAIAVGDERFDQVLMHLDLREGPQGLRRHGSRREGPGSS